MNEWLAAVEADTSNRPLRQKIVANKPARRSTPAGAATTVWSTDPAICNTSANPSMASDDHRQRCDRAVHADRRRVAGVARHARGFGRGPLTSDIMKCQLKPLSRADYMVDFSDCPMGNGCKRRSRTASATTPSPASARSHRSPGRPSWAVLGGQPLGAAPISHAGEG